MPSARIERATLIVLVVLSLVLLATVIYPFASALFVAAVLAAALMPWTERLAALLRGRRQLAAGVLTLGTLLLLIVPIAAVALSLGKEAVAGIGYVKETLSGEGVAGLINDLPAPLRALVEKVVEQIPGGEERIQELTDKQGSRAAAALGGVLGATTHAIVQVVMMLIALFFLLIDGRALVEWLEEVAPLKRGHVRELLEEFRKVTVAVLVSTVATAAIQALVALVGYLVAGVNGPSTLGAVGPAGILKSIGSSSFLSLRRHRGQPPVNGVGYQRGSIFPFPLYSPHRAVVACLAVDAFES